MNRDLGSLARLLLLGVLFFGVNLAGHGLWPADEPRYAQVAREMMRSGDFLAPHINGQPYLEKPPLLFWSMAFFSLPVGDVTPVTARIPSYLAALLTLGLTWMLAWRMFGARVAFWSALLLMTGYRFWWQASFAQIDMLLTGCMALALYHLWRWEEDRRSWRLPLIYGAMAAGMLAKGPPALLFPLLLILSFYWGKKQDRKALHWIIGVSAALVVVALWYLPARFSLPPAGEEAVTDGIAANLLRNTVGRLVMGVSKAQWPWYYLIQTPLDWLPWTLFLPGIALTAWRQRRATKMHHFLWCWVLPAFIFFSISIGKRAIYLLPIFPAVAILTALALLNLMDSDRIRWRRATGAVWAGLLLLAGIAVHVLPWTAYAELYTPSIIAFSLLAAAIAAGSIVYVARTECSGLHGLMAGSVLVLYAGAALTVFPAMDSYKSAERICAPMRALAQQDVAFALYSLGFTREEYIYYSDHFHTPVLTDLVGKKEVAPDRLMAAAKLQSKGRDAMVEAVEAIPIADFAAITQEERTTLAEAIKRQLMEQDAKYPGTLQFEDDLRTELQPFASHLVSSDPVFFFVQVEDWRWLAPMLPPAMALSILEHRDVGRRETLLMANAAGTALVATQSR